MKGKKAFRPSTLETIHSYDLTRKCQGQGCKFPFHLNAWNRIKNIEYFSIYSQGQQILKNDIANGRLSPSEIDN